MKATIVECPFGVLAFNEQNGLVEKVLFPKKPQVAAKILVRIETGKIADEVTQLVSLLGKAGYEVYAFENSTLAKEVSQKLKVDVVTERPSGAGEALRANIERFALETGFVKSAEEFGQWMHSLTMEIAKIKVKGAVEKRDMMVVQAILALDDLDKVINLFMSHVREWYGIHFPELDRVLDKHETYSRLVVALGNRDNFTAENLEREEIPKDKTEQIARLAASSMGADLVETDLAQIQMLCRNVNSLYQLRQSFESHLDASMEEVAPNVKFLVGSLLGARLIAIAGGLMNLARKPASTIQVLGAEKALFRSLKTGTRPPKHGLIFQHTLLHDAKRWQRGKIARALAGKLAIAARSDAFGGRHIGEELKADLDRRMKEILEKYSEPPPIQERKPKREERRRKFRREGRR
jgi:nucleolar protein 56